MITLPSASVCVVGYHRADVIRGNHPEVSARVDGADGGPLGVPGGCPEPSGTRQCSQMTRRVGTGPSCRRCWSTASRGLSRAGG